MPQAPGSKPPNPEDNFVFVQISTTEGTWPAEGYEKVPVHQKVRVVLEKAANDLGLVDTSDWQVLVGGNVVTIEASFLDNGLSGQIILDFGPRAGGGGLHQLVSETIFGDETKHLAGVAALRGWKIIECKHPVLDVLFEAPGKVSLRLRFRCDEYNDLPPAIELLSAAGERLRNIKFLKSGVFNKSTHPSTGFPFICSIGSREYHTHQSHVSDHWSSYKGRQGFKLGALMTKYWDAWKVQ